MKKREKNDTIRIRSGCKDSWNAFMCKGAIYSPNDIPLCPTTATQEPDNIILWDEAKKVHKNAIEQGEKDYHFDAFVAFYLDDYKFDGPQGIWFNSTYALGVLRHFSGVITPDFSTNQDFPEPVKIYNTFRMRAFGYWLGSHGVPVINNVRWGTPETWRYCWDGISKESIIAIGTVGGNPRKRDDRKRFEDGLAELVRTLRPRTIIVYGSANYSCFKRLSEQGIELRAFHSHTATAYMRRKTDE